MWAIKTILHPTDFSETSAHAFRLACELARGHGARVLVLHVVAEPPIPVPTEALATPADGGPEYDRLKASLLAIRSPHPEITVEHRLAEGDAGKEILRTAEAIRCDLIAMGTHGRSGLGRLLLGSVAEEVVRKAPCAVMTVKVPRADAGGTQQEGAEAAPPVSRAVPDSFRTPHD